MLMSDTNPDGGTPDPDDTDAGEDPTRGPQGEDGTGKGEEKDPDLSPELQAKLDRERRNQVERDNEELRAENRRLRDEGRAPTQPAGRRDLDVPSEDDDLAHLQSAAKENTVEAAHARQILRDRAVMFERADLLEVPESKRAIVRDIWEKVKQNGDFGRFPTVESVHRALEAKEQRDENARLKKRVEELEKNGKRTAPTNGTAAKPRVDAPMTVGHAPPAPKDTGEPHKMTRAEYQQRKAELINSDDPKGPQKARRLAAMLAAGEILWTD